MEQQKLAWQSKLVLLLVFPALGTAVVLQAVEWAGRDTSVVVWTLGLSTLLGLVAFKTQSATPMAALAGSTLTASLMFSTTSLPYSPLRTGLVPVLTVLILTSLSTRLGRGRKQRLGSAESRTGRRPSQVAANLGAGALLSLEFFKLWQLDQPWLHLTGLPASAVFIAGLAGLCEAAADTVSSELGQLLNSRPRMITSLRVAEPGTDGAISLGGTLAGCIAGGIVAFVGAIALHGETRMFLVCWIAAVFGLFFDSILGATLERAGWINNDAVNFLSTCSAGAGALVLLALRTHVGWL